jgi:SH3-like domain-containing protein
MKSFTTLQLNLSRNLLKNAVAAPTVATAFLLVTCALMWSNRAAAQAKPAAPATQPPVAVTDKSIGAAPSAPAPTVVTAPATAPAAAPVVAPAQLAKSYVSIGDKPAVLYDAPSTRANKVFIILRYSPLEVLVKLDKWVKVRDAENAIGWVESEALGMRRYVQISVPLADVRNAADAASALVFEAQRNVVLEVTGSAATAGWIAVKHRDGQAGFVRLAQVWGD